VWFHFTRTEKKRGLEGEYTLAYPDCVKHAYFGSLPTAADGLHWEGQVDLAGRLVSVDLSSDGPVTSAQLDAAAAFPTALSRFDMASRAALSGDSQGQEMVLLYMEHHLSELPPATIKSLFGSTPASAITTELFASRLVLQRVGLYPADEARTAVFDYSLDGDVTNYLLVVAFDAGGEVTSVEMES
jgi:hypothetical protein